MDMSEGKIAHWYVKNGDTVSKGQVVFEIETDKATMEIDAAADGIIQGINGEVGITIPVGQVVGWILLPGESVPDVLAQNALVAEAANTDATVASVTEAAQRTEEKIGTTLLRATPLARSLAREQGVDLRSIAGSGPEGRVLAADLACTTPPSCSKPRTQSNHAALNLHWFSRGTGATAGAPPIVLLHGFAASLGSWRLLAEALAGWPVAAIDLPGHGKSPPVAGASFETFAQAMLQRLGAEGIGSLHLVGHSMGGGVALQMAEKLKERLCSLTLLAPMGMGPEINGAFTQGMLRASRPESLQPWLRELFGDPTRLTASFLATAWKELESADVRAALGEVADSLLPDGTQADLLRDKLPALAIPVKVVWGMLDRITPVHQSAGLPGNVALHTLAGIGHLPHLEATSLVASLIRQQMGSGKA